MEKLAGIKNKDLNIVMISLFSVLAFVVSLFKIPLFFALPIYKLDLGESFVLLGGLCLGPINGVLIALIKTIISLVLRGSRTLMLSELTDFFVSATLAFTSSIYIKKTNNKLKNLIIGSSIGTLLRSFLSTILNYYVLIPAFSIMFNFSVDNLLTKAREIIPTIDNLFKFTMFITLPFNLVKSIISCTTAILLYKNIKNQN